MRKLMQRWLSLLPKLPLSDSILVWQAKHGDRDAFGRLYMKYLDQIYRYIYFRVDQDRAVAEDLTQTVFFKTWENLSRYHEKGNFSAWLYRIARNSVTDHLRRLVKQIPLDDETLPDADQPIEAAAILSDEIEQLRKALKQLTDEQKQVVTLGFIEEKSTAEIARILDKSEPAVRAIKSRSLKRLRQILSTQSKWMNGNG